MVDPKSRIFDLNEAIEWRQTLKAAGKSLVMTNGCFDLLHPGHMDYLNKARAEGDALLVLINSDSSLKDLKGPQRPVINEQHRAYMLASMEAVDAVHIFSTPDCTMQIREIAPDIYVKGGDYTVETINQDERVVLEEINCEPRFLSFVDGFSTSELISKIKALRSN